jgi:hypothetical protein
MSNPYKFKAGGVEKCTDVGLLILMIATSGGTAPGIKAYEVFAKLDEKGHSAASFRHTFSALVVKAKELQAKKPEVELLNAAATPKKAVGVGRKRKAGDGGEEADGGEDGASASGGGKKVKTAGKAKAAGKKGGKNVVMDEEVAGCRGGCCTKKGDRGGTQA